jgi:hypothetical protein
MRYFCTLFDHNYLVKGLALYESLVRHCPDVKLFILAMSDEAFAILSDLNLPQTELIRLSDFEDPELLRIKSGRTPTEYCWTVTPSLPLYVLKKNPAIDMISYIDADCFFFASPEPLFAEMGNGATLIIEHRYSADRMEYLPTSGRFNVGLLTFKNEPEALEVLNWWRDKCIEWCFFRSEPGRLGDQLYLDVWPDKFKRIHILRHKGGCVAPWNIWRFRLSERNGRAYVDQDPVIFYHYHALKHFKTGDFLPAKGYDFTERQLELLYRPYGKALARQLEAVKRVRPEFSSGFSLEETLYPTVDDRRYRVRIRVKQAKRFIVNLQAAVRSFVG